MSHLLAQQLDEREYLLADGATGTNIMRMGLPAGQAPDLWNLEEPEKIASNHESFIAAGADIILTNTFGSNRCRLKLERAEAQTRQINEAGVQIARGAANGAGRPVVVAGSIGPTGEIMQPLGPLSEDDAVASFTEQAEALAEGGVDVLWIESIYAFSELAAAVAAAALTGLPIVTTMTFDMAGRTMMGDTPESAVEFIKTLTPRPMAFGANCGAGPALLIDTICEFARSADPRDVIIAKGNCGVPELVDGQVTYSGSEEIMACYARMARDAGARIIGGCCGTTAAHLRAMGEALDGYVPGSTPETDAIEAALGPIKAGSSSEG